METETDTTDTGGGTRIPADLRDDVIFASLDDVGPQTAAELAQALGISPAVVTSSLGRMRTGKRVRRDSYGVWSLGEDPDADKPLPRGRPAGHSGAAEREEAVLALLVEHPEGMTRNAIAEELKETANKVWLALNRLREQDRVRTCAPVPVTAEVDGKTKRLGSQTVWAAGKQCPQ